MAQMSKRIREMGGNAYVGAERVKKRNEALQKASAKRSQLSSRALFPRSNSARAPERGDSWMPWTPAFAGAGKPRHDRAQDHP